VDMGRATQDVVTFHRETDELCVARLRDAWNPATALFDRQLRARRWESTQGTEDVTSTATCLIGLHRASIDPGAFGFSPRQTLLALCARARKRRYPGAAGLIVWANALWDGLNLGEIWTRCSFALEHPAKFVSSLTTMETAWLLSGLLHECRRSNGREAEELVDVARSELMGRFEERSRVFTHASTSAPVGHRLRRWVANFADQIYAVQALALTSISRSSHAELAVAHACASRLVELQGPMGQWWWHYDPRDGRVAQELPIFSVHQHGMGPMALMTLAAAGGSDYRESVELGHMWIRKNELGVDLLDREAGTVWRDIESAQSLLGRGWGHARSLVGWKTAPGSAPARRLRINYETRPYEWAWCLYAGAIASEQPRREHLV
jgi:hypothetical protein